MLKRLPRAPQGSALACAPAGTVGLTPQTPWAGVFHERRSWPLPCLYVFAFFLVGVYALSSRPRLPTPLSSLRRGREGGRGGLHRLNAQGGSQGLPPWRSFLTARVSPGGLFDHQGSREGTSSLGLGFIFLQIKRVFRRDPPPF